MAIYDPLNEFYKSVSGAVKENEEIRFRVKGNFDSVLLLTKKDGESDFYRTVMDKRDGFFEVTKSFVRGLYFYRFEADGVSIGLSEKTYSADFGEDKTDFQLTAYAENFTVPETIAGGIMYQIFPDRFNRFTALKSVEQGKKYHADWSEIPEYLPDENGKVLNNDFFGGDFKGIIGKLDYLVSLGVTVIYLNPIFKAYSNHRYDTGDYLTVDPLLGTEEDFDELIKRCKENGISIILDGVFNHTGADSIYFNKYGNFDSLGAYQSKNSPYFNWFSFINYPEEYESWWGIDTLPAVNESSAGYIDFITGIGGVIDKYTRKGIGGWRLDVVDELPDPFVKKIRTAVKHADPSAIIIGEVWEDASNKISYSERREYFQGEELDSVMNYPLKNAIIDFAKNGNEKTLSYVIKSEIDHYPAQVLNSLMNILSTHDTVRLISSFDERDLTGKSKSELADLSLCGDDYDKARVKLKIAALLQYTLPGVPCLYYGDEAGMQGYFDPMNRRTFVSELADKEITEWYKKLGVLRKSFSVFNGGSFTEIFAESGAYVFTRKSETEEILVAVNMSSEELRLDFNGNLTDPMSGRVYENGKKLGKGEAVVLINALV